jgi:hypothetical protein
MFELTNYPRELVPRDLAWQVRCFTRMQWPHLKPSGGKWWDFSPAPQSPTHFMLTDGALLISHASANCRELEHRDQRYRVWGLSTVFTYPDYRAAGHARRVVRAASDFIASSDADVAMLFCGQALNRFYNGCGWTAMPKARIFYGDPSAPTLKDDNLIMMMFVSAKGKAARRIFDEDDVYVGPATW